MNSLLICLYMKRFIIYFPLTILYLFLAACSGGKRETVPDELSTYASDGSQLASIHLGRSSATTAVSLYSSTKWSARITAGNDWLTVSPASGDKGTYRLSISATENGQENERTASIDFHCGETKMRTVTVIQAAHKGEDEEPEDPTFNGKTKVVAHRGFHSPGNVTMQTVSENSLDALVKAQELGIYGSEFDLWITTDNVVVVNHNASIPTDPKKLRIDTHTYNDIKDVTLSNGERVPTFEQFLQQGLKHPEMKLIAELKTQGDRTINDRLVDACVRMVKAKDMVSQVVWIAFDYENCLRVHKALPESVVQYLNGDKTPAQLKKDGIAGLDYSKSVMAKNMQWINEAHNLGLLVNVWTVDNPTEMILYINNKVDFITTNDPAVCKRYVEQLN